jgi:hypothetical protein
MARTATAWSHEGLERRGYKKCPYCWRHLVKIEQHIAAHRAGLIGPDGKRTDRTPEEARRWSQRYNGSDATERFRPGVKRIFASRAAVARLLRVSPADPSFGREVDAATDQEP